MLHVAEQLGTSLSLRQQWGGHLERGGVAIDLGELQSKLWETAEQLRANSGLKASEYALPALGPSSYATSSNDSELNTRSGP